MRQYIDGFGNICSRVLAPAGRFVISSDFIIRDTGLADDCEPDAIQIAVHNLPDDTLIYLLGSRYCETDRLMRAGLVAVRQDAAGLGAGAGHCRLRPPPHIALRLRARARRPHGSFEAHAEARVLPRLRPPGHHPVPLHEHPGPLLHRVSRRHRRAGGSRVDGFQRLVRGLPRRPLVRLRRPATTSRASAGC